MKTPPSLRATSLPPRADSLRPASASRLANDPARNPIDFEVRLLEALGVTGERSKMPPDWVFAKTADRVREFTRHGPTVIILDELHWADESSLAAAEYLARELKGEPLWILATSRPLPSLTQSRRTRLEAFENETQAQEVLLGPLSAGEVGGYLRSSEPSRELSPEEVSWRYEETGGNPLLLDQLDRRISVEKEAYTPHWAHALPLDDEAKRVLDVAAALGPAFSFDLLQSASRDEPSRLATTLRRLIDRGYLVERREEQFEFPQDRLREEAYHHLSEANRRLVHQRAGENREANGSRGDTEIFGLARDFYLGRVDWKAAEYNRAAAEIAGRALAPDIAREFLARALESQRNVDPSDLEAESKLVLDLGRLTYELGSLEEAERILGEFLNRTTDDSRLSPRVRGTLQIYLAQVRTARGDLPAAAGLAESVLSSSEFGGEPLVRAGAHHQLGLGLYYVGKYPESLAHHTEEIRLARESGNEQVIAHALKWRAADLAMMGQAAEAIVESRKVADALDRLGSDAESAQGHLFLGNMLADDKSSPLHRQEALLELRKAIQFGEKAQDPRRVGWALYHTAELLREEGRLAEAVESAQRAYDTLSRIGDRVGQGVSIKVRGQVAMERKAYRHRPGQSFGSSSTAPRSESPPGRD